MVDSFAFGAREFLERFPSFQFMTWGSTSGDVTGLAEFMEQCRADVVLGREPWLALLPDDPYQTIISAAANLFMVYVELQVQGFRPPPLDFEDDPLGFLERHSTYLRSVAPHVYDMPRTLH